MGADDVRAARFTELFEAHYDAVLRHAVRRIDPHTAADVTEEVFLVAWRRLDDVPDRALPWLLGTARKVLSNQRRSTDRHQGLQRRLRAERPWDDAAPADELDTRRRWSTALAGLSPADQEVLALTAWDGLSAVDAARVLGCSVSAYVMRLHRARRRLAVALPSADSHHTEGERTNR